MGLSAQFRPDTTKNVNFLILPAIFRTPETGWAGGLSGTVAFKTSFRNDPLTRTSSIQALAVFTERKQNIQGIHALIFFPEEKYILTLNVSHSYFPDRFWGIGPTTADEWSERYASDQFHGNLHFKKKFFRHFFGGLIYDYQNVFRVNYSAGGVFDTTSFFGKTPYYVSGAGLSFSFDTRNQAFWPTRGIFIQTSFTTYDKSIGSQFNFNRWITDIRYFQKLYREHVLAFQIYSYNLNGGAPLKNLAAMGGESNLRGFYQGRFRDNNLISGIVEYRAPLIGPLAACAFFGAGQVYKSAADIKTSDLKYSFGAGLRFATNKERLNLRVDFGYYSKYNNGLYFTVGECF